MHLNPGIGGSHLIPLFARRRIPNALKSPTEKANWAKWGAAAKARALLAHAEHLKNRAATARVASGLAMKKKELVGGDRRYKAVRGPAKLIKSTAAPFLDPAKMKMHHYQMVFEHMPVPVLYPLLDQWNNTEGARVIKRFLDMYGRGLAREVYPTSRTRFARECRSRTRELMHLLPRSERALVCHSATHIGEQRSVWGPLSGFWMFPFEG
jgi:hypothetical protein